MDLLRKKLAAGAASLAMIAAGLLPAAVPAVALAQVATSAVPPVNANVRIFGAVNYLATAYTNATTSYTATGLSAALSTVRDPSSLNSYNGTYVNETLQVFWTADVSKSTATTGTCAIALNGNVIANSARTWGYADAEGTIGGTYQLQYASGNTLSAISSYWNVGTYGELQTVAIYCKSGDTNTFTVNNGSIYIEEQYA